MDYEKEYNEALERARKAYNAIKPENYGARKIIENAFPELAESEDERNERIRKAIVHLLEVASEAYLIDATGFKKEQFLSWLEKQKESLHIPETCKERADSFTSEQKEQKPLITGNDFGWIEGLKHDLEHPEELDQKVQEVLKKRQKPVEYLDKDKVYAIMTKLTNLSYSQLIPINSDEFKKLHEITPDVRSLLDYPIEPKPAEWDELQSEFKNINEAFEDGKKEVVAHPEKYGLCKPVECADDVVEEAEEYTSKVACGEYGVEVTEAYIAGVVSERNRGTKWSEEEKQKLNRIYEILDHAADDKGFLTSKRIIGDKEAIELQNFLKSLRPQPHWKPSKEQMKALWEVEGRMRTNKAFTLSNRLASLYNDLQKLL